MISSAEKRLHQISHRSMVHFKFISVIQLLTQTFLHSHNLFLGWMRGSWDEYKEMHQHHASAGYLERIRDQYKQMFLLPESAYDTCKMETKCLTWRLRLKAIISRHWVPKLWWVVPDQRVEICTLSLLSVLFWDDILAILQIPSLSHTRIATVSQVPTYEGILGWFPPSNAKPLGHPRSTQGPLLPQSATLIETVETLHVW